MIFITMVRDQGVGKGPVAVVTGAGAGVGAASARALHAAGYRVVLLDVQIEAASKVAAALGEGAAARVCDVANEDSVAVAFAAVRDEHGRLDVLHSNAGIFLGHGVGNDGPLDTLDVATWQRTIDVNLTGAYLCSKYAMPLLLDGGGSIVFTASVSGALIGSAAIAYASSKAGVIGLTRALVLTYARHGVRVNAICPGAVRTAMSQQVQDDPTLRKRLIDNIPAGRMAEPEDIANLVVFLASPQGVYLNGAILPMEGGLVLN
jgi:meso-butanediol dehydrogenase / (S,S)-butanediol dehydrogenase / diacetyl reductase